MSHERILALDIGASTVKLAEFRALKSGGIQLINFGVGSLDIDQQTDADRLPHIIATIRDLLREKNIKPGPVVLSVAGQSVFSRFVKLPPVDKDKVYQIILYEAQQNVPFPIEEVVWDYQLIGRGEGELDVMLAAIKAEIIVGLTDAVEQAGLSADLVDVGPVALYNAVRYNYSDTATCTLVIDIGARSTDLIFMEQGRVFIRSVPVAGNAITQQIMREFELSFQDAEEMKRAHSFVAFGGAYEAPKSEVADKVSKIVRGVMTKMHAEINRSINFYRSQQHGMQPSLILLTGGCSVIPYTDNFLKEKLKVDVDYLNPFINVPVSPEIPADEIGKHAHELGQVVGVALRRGLTCPIEINLLPPKVLAEKNFKKKQPILIMAGAAIVMTLLVWAAFFFKMGSLTKERLAGVASRVQALEAEERPLQATETEIDGVKTKIDTLLALPLKRADWIRHIAEIQAAMPKELWLTKIEPVRQPPANPDVPPTDPPPPPDGSVIRLEISGLGYVDRVTSATPIQDFRNKLRDSEYFSADTEVSWLPQPAQDDVVRKFSITVVLEKPLTI